MTSLALTLADESATLALAGALAERLAPGDVIALRGPLGAGKTALARGIIRALCGPETEAPSPTFTLVQTYDAPGGPLWHFDLYRIADPGELDELGWDEALADGAALVEWPERAGDRLPAAALSLVLTPTGEHSRQARLTGDDSWTARLAGLAAALTPAPVADAVVTDFLRRHGWDEAKRRKLAGDASTRQYLRLEQDDGSTAILTLTTQPETDLGRFAAVGEMLRGFGLSAPQLLALDMKNGLAIQDDFGNVTFSAALDRGDDPAALYALAVDALIVLHRACRGDAAAPPAAVLPAYDAARFVDQVGLFQDVYLPAVADVAGFAAAESQLRHAWAAALTPACDAGPWSLLLRDYHPGNLMLLDRPGVAAAGLIDFQDAGPGPAAYDLMSLLEDARRDVADDLTRTMLARYLAAFPELDHAAFRRSYAVLAAVRHARVLGIFVRLAREQGKDGYLAHLPRVRRLLRRALTHEALAPVADWLARYAPGALSDDAVIR